MEGDRMGGGGGAYVGDLLGEAGDVGGHIGPHLRVGLQHVGHRMGMGALRGWRAGNVGKMKAIDVRREFPPPLSRPLSGGVKMLILFLLGIFAI